MKWFFWGNWNLKKDFELFLNELHDAAALNDLPALCFAQLPRASCVHFTNGEPARECIRQVKIKCSSQLNSPQIGLKLEKNILISTKRFPGETGICFNLLIHQLLDQIRLLKSSYWIHCKVMGDDYPNSLKILFFFSLSVWNISTWQRKNHVVDYDKDCVWQRPQTL